MMLDEQYETDTEPADLGERRAIDPRTLPARYHNLKAAGTSGAHALHSFQGQGPDSLARRLGSGSHALLLGKPCVLWDQPAKSGKGKAKRDPRSEAWKEFTAAHVGAVILNSKEMDAARRIVDAIRANPIAERLLFTGDVIMERPIIWAQNGRARQSTPDARRADGEHNTEIKTTRSAHPLWFLRDAAKFAYHGQLADQAAAIKYETGKAPRHSYIVAVESSPPHIVQVFEAVPATLDRGAQLCEIWLDKLQLFEATQQWGGYSDRIEPWEIVDPVEAAIADPDWLTEKEDSKE